MLFKAPENQNISEQDPFDSDALGRKESAEILTALVSKIQEPFVLAIDSPWGSGKTWFVKRWKQHLTNNGFACLYFNAWESDFSDDPLVSLIAQIELNIEDLAPEDRLEKVKTHFNSAKTLGLALAKRSPSIIVNIATGVDVEGEIKKVEDAYAKERLEKYKADALAIKEFKKKLSEFVNDIYGHEKNPAKPLIFFIDELDRCRPNYAIELLEKIKHLFNVDRVIFVLSIDKEQIGHSIKSLYGAGFGVNGYLKRFINLEYSLPEPNAEAFCRYLLEQFQLENYFSNSHADKEKAVEVCSKLFALFGLSLREQESCFTRLRIAIEMIARNSKFSFYALCFLIGLKEANLDLYKAFIRREVSHEEVLEYMRSKPGGSEFFQDGTGANIEAIILVFGCNIKSDFKDILQRYENDFNGTTLGSNERERLSRIRGALNEYQEGIHNRHKLHEVVNKIEITDRFTKPIKRVNPL